MLRFDGRVRHDPHCIGERQAAQLVGKRIHVLPALAAIARLAVLAALDFNAAVLAYSAVLQRDRLRVVVEFRHCVSPSPISCVRGKSWTGSARAFWPAQHRSASYQPALAGTGALPLLLRRL